MIDDALAQVAATPACRVVVLTGPIARQAGDILGVGHDAVHTWDRAKIPCVLVVTGFVIALVMFYAPNVRLRRF